jgi:hypothetical protein
LGCAVHTGGVEMLGGAGAIDDRPLGVKRRAAHGAEGVLPCKLLHASGAPEPT